MAPSPTRSRRRHGLALALLAGRARAHSWVACTDYRGDVNYFEEENCRAWPRNWANRGGALTPTANGYHIAADTGRNHQPGNPCDQPWDGSGDVLADMYSAAYPHATYERGKSYCLAWPTKNHAAASCTNPFIPDTSTELFVSERDPAADPTQAEFDARNVNELRGARAVGDEAEAPLSLR